MPGVLNTCTEYIYLSIYLSKFQSIFKSSVDFDLDLFILATVFYSIWVAALWEWVSASEGRYTCFHFAKTNYWLVPKLENSQMSIFGALVGKYFSDIWRSAPGKYLQSRLALIKIVSLTGHLPGLAWCEYRPKYIIQQSVQSVATWSLMEPLLHYTLGLALGRHLSPSVIIYWVSL